MTPTRRLVSGIFCFVFLLTSSLAAQEKIQEDVTVTVVEVPVRVLLKGQPVRDLAREHFKVFENGIEQAITQFQTISRRIEDQPMPGPAGRTPRLFLLIFNIYDYGPAVGAAVDDFFRDVFRPGDSVLILTEDRVLNVERGQGLEDFVAGLKDALVNFKSISTQSTTKSFRDLDYESDQLLNTLRGTGGGQMMIASFDQAIVQFFEKYRHIWEVYRNQFLLPDLSFYKLFLRKIRSFEGEKWAICFQQREMFPMLKNSSQLDIAIGNWIGSQVDSQDQVKARLVQARQEELRRSFDFTASFSPDLLSDLFLGADMTFHLILLKSSRTVFSQNFELREVGQDFEAMLKKISVSTGGHYDFSNRPGDVLREAVRKEDYHYLLVYSPREVPTDKKRAIEVQVDRDGVDIIYLKRPFSAGPDLIAISEVKARGQSLSFSLGHCQMLTVDGRRRGSASIKLLLYNEATDKVFDEGRTLELTEETTRISLTLEKLEPGNYFLIIEAVDLVSGTTDVYNGNIKLGQPPLRFHFSSMSIRLIKSLMSFCSGLRRSEAFKASSASFFRPVL